VVEPESLSSSVSPADSSNVLETVRAANVHPQLTPCDTRTWLLGAGPKYEWVPADSSAESGASSAAGSSDGGHSPIKGSAARCVWAGIAAETSFLILMSAEGIVEGAVSNLSIP
jgi:hypothetical protein